MSLSATVIAQLVLIVGFPLNVLVTFLLWRAYYHTRSQVLRERSEVAALVLIVVTVFGLIFLNNDTLPPPLDTDATRVITRLAILAIATVPALRWLWLWWRGS